MTLTPAQRERAMDRLIDEVLRPALPLSVPIGEVEELAARALEVVVGPGSLPSDAGSTTPPGPLKKEVSDG